MSDALPQPDDDEYVAVSPGGICYHKIKKGRGRLGGPCRYYLTTPCGRDERIYFSWHLLLAQVIGTYRPCRRCYPDATQ